MRNANVLIAKVVLLSDNGAYNIFHGDIILLHDFDSPLPAKCHIIMMLVILICPFEKCKMRYAICDMQNAICDMRNAKCEMRNAKTFITHFITHV